MKNKKGFTLVEVIVSIILAGIVVYFLHVMMLASYRSYETLFGVSKEMADIRVCENYLRKSIKSACNIKIYPNASASQATSLGFERKELYWDSGTGTIKNRYVVDMYIVTDSVNPVKSGRFYKDDINFCNNIPDPRDLTKAGVHELLLQVFYTDSDFDITGLTPEKQVQLLTNLKVAYYYIPSNVYDGVKRITLVKIGLDFDDVLATGEVSRHTRLFHFAARGYGLPI